MNNADEILENAVAAHRAGDAVTAVSLYRQVLAISPDNGDALRNLATLLATSGELEEGFIGR